MFDSRVGKIPLRRAWPCTPVFLPGGLQSQVRTDWTRLKWLSTHVVQNIHLEMETLIPAASTVALCCLGWVRHDQSPSQARAFFSLETENHSPHWSSLHWVCTGSTFVTGAHWLNLGFCYLNLEIFYTFLKNTFMVYGLHNNYKTENYRAMCIS